MPGHFPSRVIYTFTKFIRGSNVKAATKGKAYQSYLILYSDISEVFFPSPSQVSLHREKKAETFF